MKVLFDANVLLSYLLSPDSDRTITRIVKAAFTADDVQIVVPPELVEEVSAKALTKPYFQGKISQATLDSFFSVLLAEGETLEALEEEYATYVRDRKDDYLVAYGLLHNIDYLISGDKHLVDAGEIESLHIVSPRTFRKLLEDRGLL